MFDEILKMVKDQFGNNPQISSAIPADQQDAVHNEVAAHVTNQLKAQAVAAGGAGGLLAQLQSALTSGSPVVSAIEGGLVGSLGSRFGLSPMVTGAIAGALPGLLQKFVHKANDPNDTSITKESIDQSLSKTVVTESGSLAH
jgi:hypothetical protein